MPERDPAASPLFGYLCPVKEGEAERAAQSFCKLTGSDPKLAVSTASHIAYFTFGPRDKVGEDDAGKITVVLHGEIYTAADNQAAWLAQRFAEHGFIWAKEIHGSFALVAIDKAHDRIAVITDRLNSRRLFASQIEAGVCISSDLSAQPWAAFELDAGGVAWYITNRIVGNSRTLLRGVSVLKRACVHELSPGGFRATPYWTYDFGSTEKQFTRRQLTDELRIRLIEAVRRRLYDDPDLFLSLSAGYDASGLLGILAYSLRVPKVRCFSYEHGVPSPNSDADLSKRMAECAGYPHETVETYDGDFVRHLRDNAMLVLRKSQSWYCAEIGAWQRMATPFASVERPAVFVGDECFGWRNYGLADFSDVMASLQIYDTRVLSWLIPQLPNDSQSKIKEGLEDDLEQLCVVAGREAHGNWHHAKDYLYLDQRLGNMILPWREACIPDGVAVRSPLLDNDILDFMTRVPVSCRLNKRLYRKTITEMYPQLFAIPRSSASVRFYLNLAREFAANAASVRRLIETTSSRLDELVPPDVLRRLLSDVVEGNASNVIDEKKTGGPGIMDRLAGRVIKRLSPPRPEMPSVRRADALMRLLVLRMAMGETK